MKSMFAKLSAITILCISSMACAAEEHADDHDQVLPERLQYIPHDNDQERLDKVLADAAANDKLALIVLGANWCHDSRGFARKLADEDVISLVDKRFELLFIDVGNYGDFTYITQQFNYPAYFGTPTVLVVDPAERKLLNEHNLSKWNVADSVEKSEYISYFSSIGKDDDTFERQPKAFTDEALLSFEQEQTERLLQAYSKLSPLMQQQKDGVLEDKEAFFALWGEVRDYRFQLQQDIFDLRHNGKAELPSYPAFSWE